MCKTPDMIKKLMSVFLAAAMILTVGITANAEPIEEPQENETVSLEEVSEGNTAVTEKLTVPLDFSELEHQVTIANGLNEYDYTKESWTVLKDALIRALIVSGEAKDQTVIDDSEKELEEAIKGLIRMDYSELERALGLVYALEEEDSGFRDIWAKIDDASERAKKALVSGDQAAVNDITEELLALMDEASGYSVGTETKTEVVIKEVEVEVPPSEDFCNIPGHRAWPALFAISAALNVGMIALIAYIFTKKRNTDDNIPLVQYDIDDDMDM